MDLKALLLIQGVIVALSTFVAPCQLAPEPSPSACLRHHYRHPCVRERWRQSCGVPVSRSSASWPMHRLPLKHSPR